MSDAADVGLLATRHLFYILHGIKTKNQNNMSKQMILLRMLTCGSQEKTSPQFGQYCETGQV